MSSSVRSYSFDDISPSFLTKNSLIPMFAESAGFKSKALMILSVRNVCSNPGSNSNHDVYHVFLSEINTFAD